jgi:hypothetical protein
MQLSPHTETGPNPHWFADFAYSISRGRHSVARADLLFEQTQALGALRIDPPAHSG